MNEHLVKLFLCLSMILVTTVGFSQTEKTVTIESLLNQMVDRDALARFPESNFRLKQQSSYNRASKTPEDTTGWFMNHDFNSKDTDHNFIRTEEKNGEKEWVLMEHFGPGAIVRVWSPFLKPDEQESDVTIRIYIDGNPEPVIEGNMLKLFNGTGMIPYPFAHKSLRSGVSFFPIPYAKGIKITSLKKPFFFQYTYREYPVGTRVKSFAMEDFKASTPLMNSVGEALLNPQNSSEGEKVTMETKLKSGIEKSVMLPEGEAAVRSLVFKLGSYDNPHVTRSVVLKMEFDGRQTVWIPIGDFFGTGIGLNPVKGWYQTVDEDGTMSCRWVMPYQKSGKVSVLNLGDETVDVKLEAVVGDWKWDDRSMYFNAAWRGQYPVPTRPFSDWNYVTLKGKGCICG